MTELFLHHPFGEPDLLAAALGPKAALRLHPATLPGHALRLDEAGGLRLALVPTPGATAPGARGVPSEAERARLDFLMAALGAARAPVDAGDGTTVEAYRFAADAPPTLAWTGEEPGSAWRRRLREAIEEVVGHFGRRPAADMPALLHGIGVRALARTRAAAADAAPGRIGAGLDIAAVEPVSRTFAYARHFGIEEHVLRHRRFDGAMSPPVVRAVFTSGDAVTVLPFDPRRDAVLLIEQFRAGPHARGDRRPWCLEAVAGRCDKLEPREATARREAREEAGLELGRVERMADYYPTPGIAAEFITAFVGEADLGAAGGIHGLEEEHEDIRAVVVPFDRALAAAEGGEINNAPLLLSVYWLARHHDRLAEAWRRPLDGPGRSG